LTPQRFNHDPDHPFGKEAFGSSKELAKEIFFVNSRSRLAAVNSLG
jgi:hypothetical protein